MLRTHTALALTAVVATLANAAAQAAPTGFVVDAPVTAGLNAPNDLCFLPDGRVLVANRAGAVNVYAGGPAVLVGTVPSVELGLERGLLSIAADPAFPTNGYVYVFSSSTADAFLHVDRFTCTGDLANPTSTNLAFAAGSRRAVLAGLPDANYNRNGGALRFGPDGKLYLSVGDDGLGCPAQSTSSGVGCVLRCDVAALPAGGSPTPPALATLDPGDNPLSGNADISRLVIAHGLRDPFRMEIDGVTGDLSVGDVGENAVEEWDEYVYPTTGPLPLRNYGWPWFEGANQYSVCVGSAPASPTAPGVTVPQAGTNWGALIAGPIYRNQAATYDFGQSFEGSLFVADYLTGDVRRYTKTTGWSLAAAIPGQPTTESFATGLAGITSLRMGPDGSLWFTMHSGTFATTGGSVGRLRPLGPTNHVSIISGANQGAPALEPMQAPLVVRVFDTQNNPLPGGQVNFTITGQGSLSTTNPVTADNNGYAQTLVTAGAAGGLITVTVSAGELFPPSVKLFSRKMTVTPAGNLLVVSIVNATAATPPTIPYILMLGFPGAPPVSTPVGTLCVDPFAPQSLVFEDATGLFNFVSYSGTGSTGSPNLVKVFTVPPGIFTGALMRFTALGIDPIEGWFRTTCEQRQF